MRIIVNGEDRTVDGPRTVAALLQEIGGPRRGFAVELNREVVPRADLPTRELQDGDRVEIVTLVGGG